ncbi:hypothetical protein LCGC14_1776570, partial [marine sediment metagenome]
MISIMTQMVVFLSKLVNSKAVCVYIIFYIR